MDRPRYPKPEQQPPEDFGASSDPARRCKTCACHISIRHPHVIGQSQSLCRRNGVMLTQAGQQVGLSYVPTQPELTCFDGWRPLDTPPGVKYTVPIPHEVA